MFQRAKVISAPAIRGGKRKLEVIIIIMTTTFWSFGFRPGLRLNNIAQKIIPPLEKKKYTNLLETSEMSPEQQIRFLFFLTDLI